MRKVTGRVLLGGLITILISGCESNVVSEGDADGEAVLSAEDTWEEPTEPPITYDDELAMIADEVPGFGGVFLNDEDRVVLVMSPQTAGKSAETFKATAASALERLGTIDFGEADPMDADIQEGTYDFRQLKTWREQVTDLLAIDGAIFLDIDEVNNCVVIGVDKNVPAAGEEVKGKLAEMDIPEDAVVVEESESIVPAITLQDRVRPVQGGLQIIANTVPSTAFCTLNMAVIEAGHTQPYFVTCSHCSDQQGITDRGAFHQNTRLSNGSNRIGEEDRDPVYKSGFANPACPTGERCRYSDAIRGTFDSGVSNLRSYIFRTTFRGRWTGSLTRSSFPDPVSLLVSTKHRRNLLLAANSTRSVARRVGPMAPYRKLAWTSTMLMNSITAPTHIFVRLG